MTNLIDRYTTLTASEVYLKAHKNSGFKVGDYVKVVSKAESDENGWENSWEKEMTGAIGKIFEINYDSGIKGFELSKIEYSFPWFVLQKATREEVEQMMMEDAKKKGFVIGAIVEKYLEGGHISGKITRICFYFPGDKETLSSAVVERERGLGKPFVWVYYGNGYSSPIYQLTVMDATEKVETQKITPSKKTVKQFVFQIIEDESGGKTYLVNGQVIEDASQFEFLEDHAK